MKITQVISDTNVGGAGVLLSSIVSALKDEFEFEVILPRASLLYGRFPDTVRVTYLQVAKDRSFHPKDVATFASYFRKTRPDVIHTHAALSARIAAKLSCSAVCCSTRHCSHPSHSVTKLSAPRLALYNFCTDVTVSTADFATENLIREGIRKNRIITVKNGSPDLFKEGSGKNVFSRKSLGLPENAILIGSVARLEAVKGQDVILRAAPKILARFPNVHFVFLGDGTLKEEYKRLAASLGIERHVSFTGFAEDPTAYQRHFKLNVNASRGTETSCLAISECLSLGIPTVASDFGGNTEMIKDFENGLIFSSDNPHALSDAVIRLLSDGELYKKLSQGARKSYLESFSLDRMTEKYRILYSNLGNLGAERKRGFLDKIRREISPV